MKTQIGASSDIASFSTNATRRPRHDRRAGNGTGVGTLPATEPQDRREGPSPTSAIGAADAFMKR